MACLNVSKLIGSDVPFMAYFVVTFLTYIDVSSDFLDVRFIGFLHGTFDIFYMTRNVFLELN